VKLENDHLNNTVVVLQQQLLLERSEKEVRTHLIVDAQKRKPGPVQTTCNECSESTLHSTSTLRYVAP
jgi:hypothetical protein